MCVESIVEWHRRARPTPDAPAFNVQLGCHLEEIVEMLDALVFKDLSGHWLPEPMAGVNMSVRNKLHRLASELKAGSVVAHIADREGFLDALADQVVTVLGTGYCAGMDVDEATKRVDESNWSKFVGGRPVFDENGKIKKGPDYKKPDLTGLV